jgi:CRP-like cAMP-binding protein
MEQYSESLSNCTLFAGVAPSDLRDLVSCLGGRVVEAAKGEPVFLEGDPTQFMGVVLSGAVQVVRDDYYGNRSVLTVIQPGGVFAEAFACAGLPTMPVSVIALQPSTVLLLDPMRILTVCPNACRFHHQVVQNYLREMAQKNLLLTQKIRYMSKKTTKEKVMAFLMDQAKAHGCSEFTIPYDRQALADYLGVERSAMSAEISKLKKAGVLDTNGAWFSLLQPGTPHA